MVKDRPDSHSSPPVDVDQLPSSRWPPTVKYCLPLLTVEKAIDKSGVPRFGWALRSGKFSLFVLSHHRAFSSPSNLFHDQTW